MAYPQARTGRPRSLRGVPVIGSAFARKNGHAARGISLRVARDYSLESVPAVCDDLYVRSFVLIVAAAALGLVAYDAQVHGGLSPVNRASATLVYCGAFLVAGVAAWARRPANRTGPLMVVS
jgi:hypothetical protein